LVRRGWAWWFRKYSKDVTLGVLEEEARAAKRAPVRRPAPDFAVGVAGVESPTVTTTAA
jgi:hypothetical protein